MNEPVVISVPIFDREEQSYYTIQFIEQMTRIVTGDWLLVIVDNASTSPFTLEYLEQLDHPKVHVIRNETNLGYGAAANQGIAYGFERGIEYGIVLNNDIDFYDPDWIENTFLKYLRENPNQLMGVRLIADNLGTQFGDAPCIPYLEGFALAFHKSVWDKLGGFDPNFVAYFEDVEICKRAVDMGIPIVQSPAFAWEFAWGLSVGRQTDGTFRHIGGKTGYTRDDFDFRKVTAESIQYFRKKHGL